MEKINLVPRVLTYPPYGERERETLSLSRSVGRVGENPGNEVGKRFEKIVSKALYYIV